ncbi:MAG: RagB/SusD family nutrient uptake outer membrane protein [Mariniphaga sp.]|nr:RagB/SusD family nutrient uptake outer membrane protein [Mariniphaga sp.]
MNYKYYISVFFALLLLTGCNDGFMERYPLDSITDQTYWKSESDLQLSCNPIYASLIQGFDGSLSVSVPWGYKGPAIPYGDIHSDNIVSTDYSLVKMVSGTYVETTAAGSGGWSWTRMRALNNFLANYQKAEIAQNIKQAYAGEMLFFKAWDYFEKVKMFGEVPWFSKPLQTNSEELYNARTPRGELMDSVLATINQAVKWLPVKGLEKKDRLNRDMALLLKARICLFEGTFRKYHTELNLSGDKFLQEAASASNELMDSKHYSIWSTGNKEKDYHELFVQNQYDNHSEVILWKRYATGLLGHAFLRYYAWHQSENLAGFSKSMVEEYLCKDGLPISVSPLYVGDDSIQSEVINRDPRLHQTISIPGEYSFDLNPSSSLLDRGSGYNKIMPPIRGSGDEYPSPTGYWPIKFWKVDLTEVDQLTNGVMPCPVFRYAEALLINAESKTELGQCTQSDLDNTINKLRDRVGMPHLQLSNIPNDPQLDTRYQTYCGYKPSSLIREIRRERRVELVFENFRWDDLIRWKAGKLLLAPEAIRGMKFNQYQYPKVRTGTDVYLDNNGYLAPYQKSLPNGRAFIEPKQYYFPIPIEELLMNPKLVQNPGWTSGK